VRSTIRRRSIKCFAKRNLSRSTGTWTPRSSVAIYRSRIIKIW